MKNNTDIMKGLLKYDADATIVDDYGCLPRDTARFLRNKGTVQLLGEY